MAFVVNLLWFVFGGGIVAWLLWVVSGLVMAITVIEIPFARAAFRIAAFAAFPFGRELVDVRSLGEARTAGTGLANFAWVIFAGLWLAISRVLAGIGYCISMLSLN